MKEILVHDKDRSIRCNPKNKEKMSCEVYDSPYLTTTELQELNPKNKFEIDRVGGGEKSLMFAGTHIILREPKEDYDKKIQMKGFE